MPSLGSMLMVNLLKSSAGPSDIFCPVEEEKTLLEERPPFAERFEEPEEIGEKIANKTCIIACRQGSAVERYALENGMEIRYLQES